VQQVRLDKSHSQEPVRGIGQQGRLDQSDPGSLSKLSGSREVDLCSRYVWTSGTSRNRSELSGSRNVDLCRMYV